MKLSEVFVIVVAIIGFTTIINPDAINTIQEPLILMCRVAIVVVLFEIIPKMLKKMKGMGITEVVSVCIFPFTVGFSVLLLNPDIDENIIKSLLLICVILGLLTTNIVKRHFVKKWGVEINSSHPDMED